MPQYKKPIFGKPSVSPATSSPVPKVTATERSSSAAKSTQSASKFQWKTETVTLRIIDQFNAEATTRQEAMTCQTLGVYASTFYPGKWVVTSLTAQLEVTRVDTEEDAKRIAEELLRLFPLAFKQSSKEAIIAWIPDWVEQWINSCKEQGKFVLSSLFSGEK